ncbi:ferredoxin [Oceanicola sp. 22II-s10i]|uniref:ferredoxin n=1 Tax=Oceanicola sp. 22II-s10i TaxID=1317116 RepID=UPI000B528245|nr:ferredoxin [Oceanicola sp. 22II-s10i]OWU84003.1 ferredoxin [Oceanicola sp. 22II-s10i]
MTPEPPAPHFASLARAAAERHLTIFAAFHPPAGPDLPDGTGTLLLLGPASPGFWPHVTAGPEWLDGAPDPMDRWSRRVIGDWAGAIGATPLYPFDGPPFLPFFSWACGSGWVHASPVTLLVHPDAGLWVSFRGALALRQRIALPPPPPSPCSTCADRPCLTACPAGALTGTGYDVPACRDHLASPAGAPCMSGGCAVRSACPVSQRHGRVPSHSAYHMSRFL